MILRHRFTTSQNLGKKWQSRKDSTPKVCRSEAEATSNKESLRHKSAVKKKGSSTVCDRNTQKKTENRNTELKKTGIAPIVL